MYRAFGLVLAGGMVLAGANRADAQLSISLGNPYTGGLSIGQPYYGNGGYGYGGYGYGGYGYGSSGFGYGASSLYSPVYAPGLGGVTTYSSGYSGFVGPGTSYYSSGYYGAPGLGYAPYYGYGGWGRGMMGGWRGRSRWW
jgi:hypothetical protein